MTYEQWQEACDAAGLTVKSHPTFHDWNAVYSMLQWSEATCRYFQGKWILQNPEEDSGVEFDSLAELAVYAVRLKARARGELGMVTDGGKWCGGTEVHPCPHGYTVRHRLNLERTLLEMLKWSGAAIWYSPTHEKWMVNMFSPGAYVALFSDLEDAIVYAVNAKDGVPKEKADA